MGLSKPLHSLPQKVFFSMSYNPYFAAFQALTCCEAREFYSKTAQSHASSLLDACKGTVAAGRQFRAFHDAAIVPFTLMAIATVVQLFAAPSVAVEPVQPLLSGFAPVGLLPATKPVERVLVTPHTTSDRVLVPQAPVLTSTIYDESLVEAPTPVVEAPTPVVEAPTPVVEAPKAKTRRGTRGRKAKAAS